MFHLLWMWDQNSDDQSCYEIVLKKIQHYEDELNRVVSPVQKKDIKFSYHLTKPSSYGSISGLLKLTIPLTNWLQFPI